MNEAKLRAIFGATPEPEPVEVSTPQTFNEKVVQWDDIIEQNLPEYPNLTADDVKAVIQQESGGNPTIGSNAGAQGLMQLMPETAASLGVRDVYDPEDNIRGGMKLLSQLLKKYDGDKRKAWAAYNGGERGVDQAVEKYKDRWLEHLHEFKGVNKHTGKNHAEETRGYIESLSKMVDASVPAREDRISKLSSIFGYEKKKPKKPTPPPEPVGAQEEDVVASDPNSDVGLWGSLTSASQSSLPSVFGIFKKNVDKAGELVRETEQLAASRGEKLSDMAEEYKRRIGTDKPFMDNLSDEDKFLVNTHRLRKGLSGATAYLSGVASAIPGSGLTENEYQKEAQAENPVASTVGKVTGNIGAAVLGAQGVNSVLGKVPAVAKSPLLRTALTRMATSGGLTAGQSIGREDIGTAIGDVAQSTGGGLVSVIPEVLAPAGIAQLIAQPLGDLIYDVGVGTARGQDVTSKEWWINEVVSLATSMGFAVRDVASGKSFKVEQAAQRRELKDWLNRNGKEGFEIVESRGEPVGRDFQRADAQAEATNRHTERVNAEQEAKLKEMQSGGELDSPENAPRQIESGVPSYKSDDEILREAELSSYPPILRRMMADNPSRQKRALPAPIEDIDEEGLRGMWNNIENDQAMLENMERIRRITLKALGGKLSPSSFSSAGDKNFNFENNRFLAKKGQGLGLDRALLDFRANYREPMRELGIDLDRMETPSDFVEFLRDVATESSLNELRQNVRLKEDQYFDAVEKLESGKARVVDSEEAAKTEADNDFERMLAGGESKPEETPLVDDDGFDWLTGEFVKSDVNETDFMNTKGFSVGSKVNLEGAQWEIVGETKTRSGDDGYILKSLTSTTDQDIELETTKTIARRHRDEFPNGLSVAQAKKEYPGEFRSEFNQNKALAPSHISTITVAKSVVDESGRPITSPNADTRFSSETQDIFEGTEYGDNRTGTQKEIDAARKQQEKAREARQRENPLEGTMFDANEMEARATKQEDLFSKVRGNASVGKYAKRSGAASEGEYSKGDDRPSSRLELPEIVQYAKDILGGKAPRVKEKLRNAAASGMAVRKGKEWDRIEIRADEFEDLENVEKVLAHEIGHAHTMPGNLGEKLRNVKGRMHDFFSESPDAPPPLNNAEKSRLRRLAKKQLSKGFEKEVDEEIVKTTNFTPKQILDVWNSVDQGKLEPVLSDYIKGLDTAQKKSIVLEAMKGRVPESVPSKQERIKTGKKVKVMVDGGEATPQAIAKKYRELFMEEVKKRRLLDMAVMRKELWDLSQQWRPMPENYDYDFLKYRKEDEELYADAISVLLNDPKLLKEAAPNFHRGFFGWAENRPEATKAFNELQDLVSKGRDAVLEDRDKRIDEMFEKKEVEDKKEVQDREKKRKLDKTASWLYRMLIEKGAALEEAVKGVRKSGAKLDDSSDPFLKFRSLPYVASKQYAYLIETQKRVADALGWEKTKQKKLGKYMLLRRASTERKDIANPLGVGNRYAEDQLEYYRREWGAKEFGEIKKAAEEFADVRQEDIVPFLTDNNTFGKDFEKYIKGNRDYARFSILKEFVQKYGKSAARSILNIPKQKGTLTGVGNPFHETITNDVMLMNAKARNDFVRSTVEMLRDNPGASRFKAEKVEAHTSGKGKRFSHTENSEVKTVYYLEDGKLQAYNVDREIADIMTVDPVAGSNIPAALMALGNFQRSLFIKYSPGFLARNPVRDIKGFAVNIPKANMRKALKYTAKAFPEVWEYVKTGKMSGDMRSALKEGALPVGRSYGNDKMLKADDGYERAMARFDGDEAKEHRFVARQFQKVSRAFEVIGELQEKSVKLGGYKFIKEQQPDVSAERRAQMVRANVGTPDVYAGGAAKRWMNNLFIFSNANFQGLRAAAEAYKEDPKRFAAKMLAYEVLPKLFMAAASAGVLSKVSESIGMDSGVASWLEEAYERIPEHYKSRYNCAPLPIRTTSGKQFFVPLPSDHTGQALGAMFYQAFTGDIGEIFSEGIDVLPVGDASMQPSIQVGRALLTYMQGLNPEDKWRNYPVIPVSKFGAGKDVEAYEMAKWSAEKIGGSYGKAAVKVGNFVMEKVGASEVFYIDDKDFDLRDKHWFEKAAGIPVVGDAVGAYIKVSDRGKSEKASKGQSATERKEKRGNLTVNSQIIKHLTEAKKFDRNAARALYGQLKGEGLNVGSWSRFYRKYKREAVNRLGGPELRKIQSARTLKQREAIIESILDDRGVTGEKKRKEEKRKLMKISNLYREIN